MSRYVITGASRGIGLELVKQVLESGEDVQVAGTIRSSKPTSELQALADEHAGRLHIIQMDQTKEDTVKEAAKQLESLWGSIDVLINNAGDQEEFADALSTTPDAYLEVLHVNVVGPYTVTREFLQTGLLQKGSKKVVVNMTSSLGSIEQAAATIGKPTRFPTAILGAYKSSKSALNMQTVLLANQLHDQGFTVLALNPGLVQSWLGKRDRDSHPFSNALREGKTIPGMMTPPESVRQQMKVIEGLSQKDNGKYYNYDGEILPW